VGNRRVNKKVRQLQAGPAKTFWQLEVSRTTSGAAYPAALAQALESVPA
jgi:hypothetical protein